MKMPVTNAGDGGSGPRANWPSRKWYNPLSWSRLEVSAFVFLCAALPYVNTLFNAFVYDDNRQVLSNPYIQSFGYLREIFATTVWSYVGALRITNYYRPMMTFGYLLCYQFFGPLPYGFHLVNLLLHAAVVLVLFWVTEKMFQRRDLALAAGLIFALHPIHTESVAWIAAVTDIELSLFYLLTFCFFLVVAREKGGRSDWAQLGMAVSFVFTLLAKEQALTLPLLATLYEHGYREDGRETTCVQKIARYGLLWLLALAYLLFRFRFFGALAPVLQMTQLTWYQTGLSVVALVGQYLYKLIWPVHLCAFYVFHKSESLLDVRVLLGLMGLGLVAALFMRLWKRARIVSFGILWMLVTLAPVLNPRWLAANVFTERYLYLPSVGFCWVAASGLVALWHLTSGRRAVWRRTAVAALILVVALAGWRIVTRNRDWRDDIVLYARTLEFSPDAYHIRNNLGTVYWARGNAPAAEEQWREGLKLSPRNTFILNNLGLVCQRQKRYQEAVDYFKQAMLSKPKYTHPHLNLGITYLEMGEKDLAELQLRVAVALSPLNTEARNQLGNLYYEQGQLAEAQDQFQHSLESGASGVALKHLGEIYGRRGEAEKAEEMLKRALLLDRFDSEVHFRLGAVYAQKGRTADALRQYRTGLETDPQNPEALAAVKELEKQSSHAN